MTKADGGAGGGVKVDGSRVAVCLFEIGEFYRIAIERAMQGEGANSVTSLQFARFSTADVHSHTHDIIPLDPPAHNKDNAYTRSNTGLGSTRNPCKDWKPFVKLADGSDYWVPLDTHMPLSWS